MCVPAAPPPPSTSPLVQSPSIGAIISSFTLVVGVREGVPLLQTLRLPLLIDLAAVVDRLLDLAASGIADLRQAQDAAIAAALD